MVSPFKVGGANSVADLDLLGLDGFEVVGQENGAGGLVIDVALVAPEIEPCACGNQRVYRHGRRTVHFRDHAIRGKPVTLRLKRQRYRCQGCGATLLERLPGVDVDRNMTVRFRQHVAQDAVARTFTDTAALNGVKESLVRRIFAEHAAHQLEGYYPRLPRVLGMDEKVIQGRARFVIGDVTARTMLDMQASRRDLDLRTYFGSLDGRERVEVITQDMYWGYKSVNQLYFRRAVIVIDKFHVVRYANLAVELVRKAIQGGLDNDGRISLKRKIRLLAARPANLTDEGRIALRRLLSEHPRLETAVTCKEWFYDIYEAKSRAEAEAAYKAWLDLLPSEMERPFAAVLSFMKRRRWREFIFNYFEHPYTNAYIEALNGLIDQINRAGRGYNLETLRAKALLRYGEVHRVYPMADRPGFQDVPLHMGHGAVNLSTFESDILRDTF